MKKAISHPALWLTILFFSACTHPLSKEARLSVDSDAYFDMAKEHPEAYQGKTFMLGGIIIANKPTPEGSALEILSYDLDFQGMPIRPNEKNGRFLAQNRKFLDPALYKQDRLITLTGILTGREKSPLNGKEYTYPVFEVGEIYLWPEDWDRGLRLPNYRYPYPYNPYYPYDPFYPYRRFPYYRY